MDFQLKGRLVFFATSNANKFSEARRVLAEYRIAVGMLRIKSLEMQSDNLEEIAEASVKDVFNRFRLPIVVEDAGLFIESLNGFPGPYAAYVYKTIGNRGVLRLMENMGPRKARFESVIAYFSSELRSPICFNGAITGEIATEERRGSNGSYFGFDPIFRPNGKAKTFAEMSLDEKNRHSHRAMALREFAKWYVKPERM